MLPKISHQVLRYIQNAHYKCDPNLGANKEGPHEDINKIMILRTDARLVIPFLRHLEQAATSFLRIASCQATSIAKPVSQSAPTATRA